MKKIALILACFVFLLGSAFASTTAVHSIDNVPISNGAVISTGNPFEYKIVLHNYDQVDKYFYIQEDISKDLDLVSSNVTPVKTASGEYNTYQFYGFLVPANSEATLIMNFKNNSSNEVETTSINTRFYFSDWGIDDYQVFIFKTTVPAIPEFPLVAIPIGIVLGSFFIISRRKK